MAESSIKIFSSFSLENLKILQKSIIFLFPYKEKSFTPQQYDLIIFSYFRRRMCCYFSRENTKENKRFQLRFGEVKEFGKFIKLFLPLSLQWDHLWILVSIFQLQKNKQTKKTFLFFSLCMLFLLVCWAWLFW